MDFNRKRHCTYLINCHLIFVVKYRQPVINEEMGEYLLRETERLLGPWNAQLLEGNTDKDHMHLLVSIDPQYQISDMVGSIKGVLSRLVRRDFKDHLSGFLWGDSFWTDSYYIASVGNASDETIRKYIQDQGKPKRKYVKHTSL